MRSIPNRFAHYVQQMRVFAGEQHSIRCGNVATGQCFIRDGELPPLLSKDG
jgi:hypothetical protein